MENKNFIQYIDSDFRVKTKYVEKKSDSTDDYWGYVVDGINTEFLIVALFVNNVRVQGVEILNKDNVNCSAVINDLAVIDLNTIEKNFFFSAFEEVVLDYIAIEQKVRVINFPYVPPVEPTKYLHKYSTPYLLDVTQKWTDYNPYLCRVLFKFDTAEFATSNRIFANDSFNNESTRPFINYFSNDVNPNYRSTVVPFTEFVRFFDCYVKVEPQIGAFMEYSANVKKGECQLIMDVRTNEIYLQYFGFGFPDAEIALGGRGIKKWMVKPVVGGQVLTTPHFIVTIMNQPLP